MAKECQRCKAIEMGKLTYKSRRLLHAHILVMNPDKISRWFVHIIASDPELDATLNNLDLWPEDIPWRDNGWSHHDGWRTQ